MSTHVHLHHFVMDKLSTSPIKVIAISWDKYWYSIHHQLKILNRDERRVSYHLINRYGFNKWYKIDLNFLKNFHFSLVFSQPGTSMSLVQINHSSTECSLPIHRNAASTLIHWTWYITSLCKCIISCQNHLQLTLQ